MFTLRYEYGQDRINGDYNTVGGFVNVGFQLENLLSGESPFTLPEPVFRSPRDLTRSPALKVRRNWSQPHAVVLSRSVANQPVCPNLQGSVYIAASITSAAHLSTIPAIPPLVTSAYTFCWCGYTGPTALLFVNIFDGANVLGPISFVHIDGPSGCESRIALMGASPAPNGLILVTASPPGLPLTFSPGGGVSVQVNQ
jgi:hypothetical protein